MLYNEAITIMIRPINHNPGESSFSPKTIAKTPAIVIRIGNKPVKIDLKTFIIKYKNYKAFKDDYVVI